MSEKLKSLRFLIPILLLFGLIIGGTFAGWFTATVGGAVGAVAVVIYALCRRMPIKQIAATMVDAAIMEAGIFPIIVAGQIFSKSSPIPILPTSSPPPSPPSRRPGL